MFAHVQGRKDASREWGQHIDEVIFDELKLIPNCADHCIYHGIVKNSLVMIARATDDLLIAPLSFDAYQTIVKIFGQHWKIHDMGIVEHYFGLQFVHSPSCISIDQTHLVKYVLLSVFGNGWKNQVGQKKDLVPMLIGTSHAEALAGCIPFDKIEMEDAIKRYGFHYRILLGQLQHLSRWTQLDLQTATQCLAQYQNAPGKLHFDG